MQDDFARLAQQFQEWNADPRRKHFNIGIILSRDEMFATERALRMCSRLTVENVLAAIAAEGADGCASEKEIATAIVRKLTEPQT